MDNASYFIKNKSLFGSFPTQESVEELENNGVVYFVDLTDISKEKNIKNYKTQFTYINYPIEDNHIPTDLVTFSSFIIYISNIIKKLKNTEKVYIHCRGGHSRSAIVVACILCYIFNLTASESLDYTTKCHSSRVNLRDRWRKLSAPQSSLQKKFVYKFLEPVVFYKYNKQNIFTYSFSIFSQHEVVLNDKSQIYLNVKDAYDTEIIKYDNIDEKTKIKVMKNILKIKFENNKEMYNILINTHIKPIIYGIKDDSFWGECDGKGKNMLGKILMKIRNEYYEQIHFN